LAGPAVIVSSPSPSPSPTASPATLANGDSVFVEGTADPTTGTVTATVVDILPADSGAGGGSTPPANGPITATGSIASLGSDGTSFVMTIQDGQSLAADSASLTVETSSSTVYQPQSVTAATVLSSASIGKFVFVTGTLDTSTGVLNAQTVSLLPPPPAGYNWPG
jgi:hypothetical protein